MKEEICQTSLNFKYDITKNYTDEDSGVFILPEYRNKSEEAIKINKDKYSIKIKALRNIIPELIFNPNLIGINEGGLHDGIMESVKTCHEDFSNLLLENIILSGKNTLFKNFKERL
jgi:actin-related protein